MDENKLLKENIVKLQKDREIQNAKRLESSLAHSKETIDKGSAPDNSMDGSQALIGCLRKIDQEKQFQNAERLKSALPNAKEINDNPYTIDNSMEGAVLIKEGIRTNIYQKGKYFFLGNNKGISKKLYAPTRDRAEIERSFEEANSDDID